LETISDFEKLISVVPIYNALDIYATEKAQLATSGKTIDDFDLLIGATALANNMILVTDNEKHFKNIQGIKVENWVIL
jgi:tRNA(fMet)-specific endonuclease VapC